MNSVLNAVADICKGEGGKDKQVLTKVDKKYGRSVFASFVRTFFLDNQFMVKVMNCHQLIRVGFPTKD